VILCDIRVRDPRLTFLRARAAAFVTFGRALGDDGYSWVDVDGAAGLRLAVQHLLDLGHRRIAFLGTARDYSFSHFRFEGYVDALLAAGIPCDDHLIVQDLAVGADLDDRLARMLALPAPPTAIIACADFLAASALSTLRRLGKSVPDDVSLVAFDDTLITQHAEPPLTTLRQDNQAIGTAVAGLLIRQLREPDRPPEHTLLQPSLVIRGSSSQVAGR
jgi:LacI family transcriptional regulator